ncbi:hypothetical protein [Streptantibioticus ferralitis]|uniref:Uncharacterized protein n=1 Tax=Streptantibioticus ferralitis TaxID=236510 RepID=A0ABT5YUH4_9ACTN|nr:hypothetical protein [Streptantibioticus ferralitis]MDF2255263.1 hypothetical protein [Streptantibioticus ferralitis]
MEEDRHIDLFRLRNDTCSRCFATGVRLVMTGPIAHSPGEQAPILHCELCHAISEAARHAQSQLRDPMLEWSP